MIAWLIRLLGGGLFGELRGAISDWRNADNEEARIEAKERVDTLTQIIESQRVQSATVQAGMQYGGWVFWGTWALFAVPLGIWWAAVVLDSLWLFSGAIPDLPQSIRPWANQIFDNIFLAGGGVAGATVIGRAIMRR